MRTKIFAAYLPQFYETEENNLFWGKGFTDWVGVRNAHPLYNGHDQPRIPLGDNYYDLSDSNVLRWQSKLANQYGIDGFNIYHYWFENCHKALNIPAENLLNNPDIKIRYFFSWDNISWKRTWSNIPGNDWAPLYDNATETKQEVLLKLDYGDTKCWEEHFNYLLQFFKDDRYYKIDGKPVFVFMRSNEQSTLVDMIDKWKELANKNGFPGLYIITGMRRINNKNLFDAQFVHEPSMSAWGRREFLDSIIQRYTGITIKSNKPCKYLYDYEKVWKRIVKYAGRHIDEALFMGAVVGFDDTPRRGGSARVLSGCTPQVFEKYFRELYRLNCKHNKEVIFLNAWNEWGEGAYLEPDTKNRYDYLEALNRAISEV